MRLAAAADALLLVLDSKTDWAALRKAGRHNLILCVAQDPKHLEGAQEHGLTPVLLDADEIPVQELMETALLECVANDILEAGSQVVAVYSGFHSDIHDSISLIRLDEHLGRLTAKDLRKLETRVPLETLKSVVDLAVEIGFEGREGKHVGTLFVVGDARNVLEHCHPAGFDPVRGYKKDDRNLKDARTRDAVKEIAQLDGAMVVGSDGVIERSCQIIQVSATSLTYLKV